MRKFNSTDIIAIGAKCICLYIITLMNFAVLHGAFVEHQWNALYTFPVSIGIWVLNVFAIVTIIKGID